MSLVGAVRGTPADQYHCRQPRRFRHLETPPQSDTHRPPVGIVELVCLALYLVPRTSVPGAILLTGYLGGAIATHVRAASPLFSHTRFPLYVALMLWGGLYLREPRLVELLPYRR
jgi:hypothetical protein